MDSNSFERAGSAPPKSRRTRTGTGLAGHRSLYRAAIAAEAAIAHAADRSFPGSRQEFVEVASAAACALGLRGAARQLLKKLASCFGGPTGGRLLVYPSNAYLVEEIGVDERTIRRAIGQLIECEVLLAKDHPRRHRYCVRNGKSGAVVDAFGFDLTPLWLRRLEWAARARAIGEVAETIRSANLALSRERIAIRSALAAAAPYDTSKQREPLIAALTAIERQCPAPGRLGDRTGPLAQLCELRVLADTLFYDLTAGKNEDAEKVTTLGVNVRLSRAPRPPLRLQTEDSTEGLKLRVPPTGAEENDRACGNEEPVEKWGSPHKREAAQKASRPIPLPLLYAACPDLASISASLRNHPEIIAAGEALRPCFGASRDAWLEGVATVGLLETAQLAIYVHQLACDYFARNGPPSCSARGMFGARFRTLIRRTASRRFDLYAALLALRRRRIS
jgi:replication initiation protein RepC